MIDEDRTMQLYGYTSDELKPQSSKPTVAVCEECGKYRVLKRQDYRGLCWTCANVGVSPTPETLLKMSKASKNRPPVTDETKRRMSAAHVGLNGGSEHWNWKGGISAWRIMLHNSLAYKNWREAVFERDDYTCQMCTERGGYLEAHHIEAVKDHKNDLLVYDVDNGITLCKECHLSINNGGHVAYTEQFKAIIGGG